MLWVGELLAVAGVFSAVIIVHELGHFLAAKAAGVTVPLVSFGFGPAVWQHQWGETVYRVALLPFGGFVGLASRHSGDQSSDATQRLEDTSLLTRLGILSAGVGMNMIVGVLMFASLATTYRHAPREPAVFGGLRATSDTPWGSVSLVPGDTIRAVDGHVVDTWDAVVARVATGADSAVVFRTHHTTATVRLDSLGGDHIRLASLLEPYVPPVVASIIPQSIAARTGLKRGDSLTMINGHATRSWSEVRQQVQAGQHQSITFQIIRAGRSLTLIGHTDAVVSLASPRATTTDLSGTPNSALDHLGIIPRPATHLATVPLIMALYVGGRAAARVCQRLVPLVGRLLIGRVSLREIQGPLAIAQQSAQAAHRGVADVVALVAYLSINIALMNLLLPLPMLDGGQILLTLIEGARGVALSTRVMTWLTRGSCMVIVVLSCVLFVHDTVRMLGG